MNRLKRYLPISAMKLMHDSSILSHPQFGITNWGFEWDGISKLQKWALCIMTNSKYNAHTEPLFKQLHLLKVKDIFDVQCLKFWYKFVKKKLPNYFRDMFKYNCELHEIRSHDQLHLYPTRTSGARNVSRHHIPELMNKFPKYLTETHNLYSIFYSIKCYLIDLYNYNFTIIDCYICNNNNWVTNRLIGNFGPAAGSWLQAATPVAKMTASGVAGDLRTVIGFRYLVTILINWPHPHTLFTLSKFTLWTNIFLFFMNVLMIAMATQIPVIMSLTISIVVYVKTITHSSHSLKLEFMIAALWSLTGFVFVLPCMTTTGAAGDHRLLYHFRKCCTSKKYTIILFSSFGFIFITPPYTYVFPYPTWVHIQLRWFNAEETQLHGYALIHRVAICYLVNMKLFCVPNIAVHVLIYRLASMPAVRFYLNGGLLTCLFFIINHGYNVIFVFLSIACKPDMILVFFMLNKPLSESESDSWFTSRNVNCIYKIWYIW